MKIRINNTDGVKTKEENGKKIVEVNPLYKNMRFKKEFTKKKEIKNVATNRVVLLGSKRARLSSENNKWSC